MANYFVMGGDSKEYGPVSADDLRKWIAEGRADAQSRVRVENTSEWLPLAQIPELAGTPAKNLPPLPVSAQPPAAKTSGMAVASLVLGILGLFTCGGTALFGLVLGIVALVKVNNSRGALSGKGLALAGIIVSGFFLFMVPVFAGMLLPALASAHNKARQINCINNEKQLALAIRTYSADNANHFPPAATWCDAIKASVASDNVFRCPAVDGSDKCDYAYNAKLDGMDASNVNPQTVLIYESDAGWNGHGGPESLAAARHHGKMVVAYADGSVQTVSASQIGSLHWDP
jgi:hypothetical protein